MFVEKASEITVSDCTVGWLYRDCVSLAQNYSLPAGRGSVTPVLAEENHGLQAAWFNSWRPNSLSGTQLKGITINNQGPN